MSLLYILQWYSWTMSLSLWGLVPNGETLIKFSVKSTKRSRALWKLINWEPYLVWEEGTRIIENNFMMENFSTNSNYLQQEWKNIQELDIQIQLYNLWPKIWHWLVILSFLQHTLSKSLHILSTFSIKCASVQQMS